ncbi:metallophosphoesterase [Pseudoalteromonas luteoviolacea]|nr:metallophosphoesterase [Pseudoalteromonas luteoviolacea]
MYHKSNPLLVILSVLMSFTAFAGFNDGPYIYPDKNGYRADLICQGKKRTFVIKEHKAIDFCGRSMKLNLVSNAPTETVYSGAFPVVALSDIHGQHALMMQLLKANKIIDQNGNWIFGKGHLVITGDIFDRGSQVTESLWYIKWLENEAAKFGGAVHFLLGNHEVMVLNGDLRYLHKKYEQTASLMNKPFDQLFSKDSVLGQWLRSKNVVIKINNNVFLHGGFHHETLKYDIGLKDINKIFREELVEQELSSKKRSELGQFLHGRKGPIWHRGFFSEEQKAQLAPLLARFSASRFIVGHTSHKTVISRYNGKVIGVDSSIKLGHKGELLFIEEDGYWRADMQGKRTPLFAK